MVLCHWVAVRLVGLLPSERNGRVSGVLMAWVGRLRVRASNCRRPICFSLSPSAVLALRVLSVSCVAYLSKGIRSFRRPFPPDALNGCGVDIRQDPCSWHVPPGWVDCLGPWRHCPFSRMRNAMRGRGRPGLR